MKTIHHNGHRVELYDSIQELPIWRFQLYNRYMVIDAGIGSDLADIDTKLNDLRTLIQSDPASAIQQSVNLQQALHFAMSKVNPRMNAFAVLIHKIDGQTLREDDLTDEGIVKILRQLSQNRLSIAALTEFLAGFKKKMETEFEFFFPGVVDNAKTKSFYANLRRRTLLVLRSIQEQSEAMQEQIAQIDSMIQRKMKPKTFGGSKGIEVQMIKEFESTLVLLRQHNVANEPRHLSTLAYYQALEVVKQQQKQQERVHG